MAKQFKIDLKRFGGILRGLRKKHDLIQDEIAKFLQIKRASYSGVERGTFGPGPSFILGIYTFYKAKGEPITIDYLYGVEDVPGMLLGDKLELDKCKEDLAREKANNVKLAEELEEQKGFVKKLIDKI